SWSRTASGMRGSLRRGIGGLLRSDHAQPAHEIPDSPRLTREIRELGYVGAYTAVKRFLAAIRPENGPKPYEVRFETPPGLQAQVDFARFVVDFADDPGSSRVVWLFGLVLDHSRFLFARYVLHQDLQTLLITASKRCWGSVCNSGCSAAKASATI